MTTIYEAADGTTQVISPRRKAVQRYRRLCRDHGGRLYRDLPSLQDPHVYEVCDITASDSSLWFPVKPDSEPADG